MCQDTFNRTGIFRSESPLTSGYTPAKPVNRIREHRKIREAILPIIHGNPPDNLLVHGPAGAGKTTVIRHAVSQLTNDTQLETAYLNCWQYSTRLSLLPELLRQINYPQPRKGKPVDELLEKLREWLHKHRGVIVVLEEFDQLDDMAAIAYDLQQTSADADTVLGLIMVSNLPPPQIELDPRSQSRLTYQSIKFRPYSKQEFSAILEERVDEAFQCENVPEDVIRKIAAIVAEQSGDCREALTLLLRAGRLTEQQDADRVTIEHIEQSNRMRG